MRRPEPGEHHPYYDNYIDLTRGANLLQNLQDSGDRLVNLCHELGNDKANYSYAPGKWTVKQMLRHIIDADMVFIYRAVTIARNDRTNLPGFDENDWAKNADVSKISLDELIEEFTLLRRFIIRTFKGLGEDELDRKGNANGSDTTVLSIGFILAGHSFHHANILQERYQ